MKFWFYSNLAKHPEKPKLASMHFLTSQRGPGEYAAYSQTLPLSLKSSLRDYWASSSNA